MRRLPTRAAALAAAAAVLLGLFVAGPASALAPESASLVTELSNPPDDGRLYQVPPAPRGADATTTNSGIQAASPTITPSVSFELVRRGGTYSCGNGTLCTAVWDPVHDAWKIFKLYACNVYQVHNWQLNGWYVDKQTYGQTSYFKGQSYYNNLWSHTSTYNPFTGSGAPDITATWDPVWMIHNCGPGWD
ncbi:hypothetical protein [Promicromonospora sp. NPDC059942]|uniref:hypothetical protein n=1 Tax=Promicromonospora sp. NPDC059942 TaxID=3347009 RepID=UPI003667872E